MKINRRQFLKALPAAALALTACGSGQQEAPATTDALVLDHAYPLDYARQFTADVYTDGSVLLTIAESGDKFLVRPEGAAELSVLPEGTVELRQPLENIYLVSSSMMDYFIHLDALDSIALSGTRGRWLVSRRGQSHHGGGRDHLCGQVQCAGLRVHPGCPLQPCH